jgi:hypothetical protein
MNLSIDDLLSLTRCQPSWRALIPLSQLVAEVALSDARGSDSVAADKKGKDMPRGELDVNFEPWSSKRASILTKYTTSEKLSITTSFLTTSDKEKG